MSSPEEVSRLRRELWQEFSAGQVELLRTLRDDISSRRWEIMLEVDAVRKFVAAAEDRTDDPELKQLLGQASKRLDEIHRELSRIPEDVIPAF